MKRIKKFFQSFGPGIITGASDDDPSGIATYTQTGAKFGYNQLWVVIFIFPLLVAVQEACVRIGAVTGQGLAAVIKKQYNKKILYLAVGLIFIANTINIGADIGAMAAVFKLLLPINFLIAILFFKYEKIEYYKICQREKKVLPLDRISQVNLNIPIILWFEAAITT